MGTRNRPPSERNRNLDFTILNKEAMGPAFLVLNLERTRGIEILGSPQCGRGNLQSIQLFFFFSPPYRTLRTTIPLRLSASMLLRSLPAPQLFPRAQGIVGLHRGLPRPRLLHLSPPCCPRVTEATRGLRLPACVARTPAQVPRWLLGN